MTGDKPNAAKPSGLVGTITVTDGWLVVGRGAAVVLVVVVTEVVVMAVVVVVAEVAAGASEEQPEAKTNVATSPPHLRAAFTRVFPSANQRRL
ncbi:MAG: hypothetical protein HKN03_19040 [Acidimicrobiales bacterium]|nr:hypothetical protein [Acidimicrobiales bacterium]